MGTENPSILSEFFNPQKGVKGGGVVRMAWGKTRRRWVERKVDQSCEGGCIGSTNAANILSPFPNSFGFVPPI